MANVPLTYKLSFYDPSKPGGVITIQENNANTAVRLDTQFSMQDIIDTAVGYKSYAALLTQSGGDAPVATVLRNDTGQVLTWARTGVGTYTLTSSVALFDNDKTAVFVNQGGALECLVTWVRTNDTTVTIQTWNGGLGGAAALVDGLLGFGGKGAFEVRIY